MTTRILCLCLGNICRSPMAEGVLRARAEALGITAEIDSAGTGGWHVGEAPDPRAQAATRRKGYAIAGQRARQITRRDFADFDLILAMDAQNLSDAQRLAPSGSRARIVRFLDIAGIGGDVPDPYYTGRFDEVLALIERAADLVLEGLRA